MLARLPTEYSRTHSQCAWHRPVLLADFLLSLFTRCDSSLRFLWRWRRLTMARASRSRLLPPFLPVPVIGQTASACTPSSFFVRLLPAAFTVPAAFAGYHVVHGKSQVGASSLLWHDIFAWIGAWRSAALPGHNHPCRTPATSRGFAERTSAGSHCHEGGGMTSISSGEIIYNQSVGWPRD